MCFAPRSNFEPSLSELRIDHANTRRSAMPSQDGAAGSSREHGWALSAIVVGLAIALALARPCAAAVVECASGDVTCLITAVNTANASGGANTIQLQPGTYSLRAPDNDTEGPNGLPSITSALTIVGAGA